MSFMLLALFVMCVAIICMERCIFGRGRGQEVAERSVECDRLKEMFSVF